MGFCYQDGIGTQQNDGFAFESFKKAADQGYSDAYYWLALCYRNGIGCQQDDELAFVWITKAVENNFEKNLAEAYLFLGKLYADGKGVAQSDGLAFKWFAKAAEKELAEAQLQLASCYEHGIGVERNMTLAEKWYEDAFEQGYFKADAQFRLAERYLQGLDIEKNYELGMKWMIRSAHEGYADAYNWLINAFLFLAIPKELMDKVNDAELYKFVFDWCSKKAHGNNEAEANLVLGILYSAGKGVQQSDKLGFICVERAKKTFGDLEVESEDVLTDLYLHLYLSNCYAQGKGVNKDFSKAKSYYRYYSNDLDMLGSNFMEGIGSTYKTQNINVFLTLLRIELYIFCKEYDLAKECIEKFFENTGGVDKNFKEILLATVDQAKVLDKKNQRLEETEHRMQKLVEQFTHSLGNVIFPDTIYQVAERLKNNPDNRKDVLLLHEAYHSEIIIKLQGELLRQRYANTNPEKFRQFIRSCRRTPNSAEKTKSIEDILDYAASRVTARFLNQHYAGLNSIRDKMLSKKNLSLDALKQKFEDDILLNKSLRPIAWINQYLRPVQITEISPLWKKVFILSESHAEALLFGYFSEILFNAFKYADHDKDEFLTVVFDEKTINDKTYLTCSWLNPVKDKSPAMLGTGKGLDAIQEDLKQLNDTESPEESLLISQQNNQFQVTLFFKKDLLVNDLPSLKLKRKANVE